MAETKLKQQAINTTTGIIQVYFVPANGFTAGNNNTYWGFSYGVNIIHQVLTTAANMTRAYGMILPNDVDLTGNLVFKLLGSVGSNATVTPNVLIGYARNGAISALGSYNNADLATLAFTTTDTVFTMATIAGSNWNANDMIIYGLALKSSQTLSLRSAWIEYTKKPLA